MAKNNFKPFATGAGANVTSQADWEALTALLTGFQSGKAASAQVNKALRQGTVMASVIGQFIADSTGQDVLDNGNTSAILTNFLNALKANTNGRLLNVRTFTASGTYIPTAGTKKVRVRLVGGGGGGGGAAANTTSGTFSFGYGGSSGCYGDSGMIDASSITTVAVTVGSAGTGGVGAGNGTSGGNSSFGSFITAQGGPGGNGGASTTAGTAVYISNPANTGSCTGTNIMLSIPGGGFGGLVLLGSITYTQIRGGEGGSSMMGFGGNGGNASVPARSGTGYGAGGAGASALFAQSTAANNGGNGSAGVVVIEEYA